MKFCYATQASSVSRLTSPRFLKMERIHSRYSTRRYQKWPKRVLWKEKLLRSPIFQHGSTAETNIWNQWMGWWGWQSISDRFYLFLILSFSASYQIYAIKNGTPRASENQLAVLRQWWDAYPAAKSSPPSITGEELAALIRNPSATREFAIIDVRRNDYTVSIDIFCFGFIRNNVAHDTFKGGHICGSYNLAAQTFYDNLPNFFHKFHNTPKVIFYCNSSKGRGPRCAGW